MDVQHHNDFDPILGVIAPICSTILLILGHITLLEAGQLFAFIGAGLSGMAAFFYYGYLFFEKIKINRKKKYHDAN